MPYSETQNVLWGTLTDPMGNISLTGKYYIERTEVATPNRDSSRGYPIDVSAFSDSHTSRTYFTKAKSWSEIGTRVLPGSSYVESVPVAYFGGMGSYLTLEHPYDLNVRLASRIKGQTANLGITLAKYRELCTLWGAIAGSVLTVGHNLQRIRNPRNWLRGNKHRLNQPTYALVKGASALYLGYLFGLKQLAKDLDSTSDALRRRFEDPVYLRDSFTVVKRDDVSYHVGNGYEEFIADTNAVKKVRVKCRYRVFPNDQVLAQMGITNPLQAVYDFIPFSFVLNWLIPVGRHIAALDALQGIADLRWYYTTHDVSETWVDYPWWGKSASYRYESLSRSGLNKELGDIPFPRFEPSTFASNVLTGVALLAVLNKDARVGRSIIRI